MCIIKTTLMQVLFSFLRRVAETKVYYITFSGLGDRDSYPCQSTGKETIRDMVANRAKKPDVKASSNFSPDPVPPFFHFKTEDKVCIKNGLPVGALSSEEKFLCDFKKNSSCELTHYMREYNVNEYSRNWDMGYFLVSLSNIAAGASPYKRRFPKDSNMKLRVDFFKDETVFEALVWDKRFTEQKLRLCEVECDWNRFPISFDALHFQNKVIEICRQGKENPDLPKSLPPSRPHPDLRRTRPKTSVQVEPGKVKTDGDSQERTRREMETPRARPCTAGPSTAVQPVRVSSTALTPQNFPMNFEQLIKDAFFHFERLNDKERQKVARECNAKLRNFALGENRSIRSSQLKDLAQTVDAVGAIFLQNEFVGTCFGTGEHYVVTNNHVFVKLIDLSKVVIDFNYEFVVTSLPERRYQPDYLVLRSEKLDFAVLKLKERSDKVPPPCIFSTGVTIPNPRNFNWSNLEGHRVHLIGHPDGQPRQVDPMCPVVTDSLELYVYALRTGEESAQANKAYRQSKIAEGGMYHVSSFFYGASGSPGIVFLPGVKQLVVLHTCGVFLRDRNRSFIEQGVLMTEIVKYVYKCIQRAQKDPSGENILRNARLNDIFPGVENWFSCPMDID